MANNRVNAANINKAISIQVDQEFIGPAVNNFVVDVTANSPVDTGRLQTSWRKEKINENEYRIRNIAPYIRYVINGTANRLPNSFVDSAIGRWFGFGRQR